MHFAQSAIDLLLRGLRVYYVNGLRRRPGRDPRRSIFIHRGAAARPPLAYFVVKLTRSQAMHDRGRQTRP
jgi:hypothetical protein